jgi:4'-phosphopantetheinyl transferase EntD
MRKPMSLATLPVAPFPSGAPYTIAFANSSAPAVSVLTQGERREYEGLPHEDRRRDWLAGRCAAKRAVAKRCGIPLHHVQLKSRPGAAPLCTVLDDHRRWMRTRFSVSIAHRDGWAIAAAAEPSIRVGVDIDRADEIAPEYLRYFLAPRERCCSGRIDVSLAWVLKEAAWKALALGSDVPFTALQLSFDRDTRALQGVRVATTWMAARAQVVRFSRPGRMVSAVVEIRQEVQ